MKTLLSHTLSVLRTIVCAALTIFSCSVAQAQNPIRLMVGFPPGGTTDVIARALANELSKRINREVVVENKPGASGNIAASSVARAAPDGSTLLFVASTHATNASLYRNLNFDTRGDFSVVSMVATSPYVLVVNPTLPAKSLDELTEYLKKHPGKVNFASASPGTGQHLAGEIYKKLAKVDILHVPYKGSAAALSDLIAGRVEMMFDNIAVMLPHIKSEALRPLAVTTQQRFNGLPQLPTMAEKGYAEFNVSSWFAVVAPAKTRSDYLDKLNQSINEIIKSDEFVKQLADFGAAPMPSTREQSSAYVEAEIERWQKVINDLGIRIN